MKTKDRIKEEIGLYKLLITIFSAVDFSLISYLWNNKDLESWPILVIITTFVVIVLISLIILYYEVHNKIKQLDSYD